MLSIAGPLCQSVSAGHPVQRRRRPVIKFHDHPWPNPAQVTLFLASKAETDAEALHNMFRHIEIAAPAR